MKVDEKDVQYVAGLANLELTAEEQTRMVRDLNSILGYVDRLGELNTEGVEPMAQVRTTSGDGSRADEPQGLRPSLAHEAALANAPQSDADFFLVPKVIEK
jgi:aspartyl-tRNA(Asn)/glutamyl-tRNA(Gln) amidotransferase subunit C